VLVPVELVFPGVLAEAVFWRSSLVVGCRRCLGLRVRTPSEFGSILVVFVNIEVRR